MATLSESTRVIRLELDAIDVALRSANQWFWGGNLSEGTECGEGFRTTLRAEGLVFALRLLLADLDEWIDQELGEMVAPEEETQ